MKFVDDDDDDDDELVGFSSRLVPFQIQQMNQVNFRTDFVVLPCRRLSCPTSCLKITDHGR